MIEPATPCPMFPLGTVLLPGEVLPLHVFEPRYRAMMAVVLGGARTFGVILIKRGLEVGGGDERVDVGTLARVVEAAPFPDGRYALLIRGEARLRIASWHADDPYPRADVAAVPSGSPSGPNDLIERATGAVRRARALLSELGATLGQWDGTVQAADQEEASWRLCSLAPFGPFDRQRILELDDPSERLRTVTDLTLEIAEDAARMLAEGSDEP
jgi:Lon protease-like protein